MYKISINLKSFDLLSLQEIEKYLFSIFSFFNLNKIQQKVNPIKCKKITVLRSPHIDKKSREQFQIQSHKKTFVLTILNRTSVLLILEILKTSKFRGVELEILVEYYTF